MFTKIYIKYMTIQKLKETKPIYNIHWTEKLKLIFKNSFNKILLFKQVTNWFRYRRKQYQRFIASIVSRHRYLDSKSVKKDNGVVSNTPIGAFQGQSFDSVLPKQDAAPATGLLGNNSYLPGNAPSVPSMVSSTFPMLFNQNSALN